MDIIELTQLELLWLSLAVATASMITSITGMAGGVLMFAAMNIYMPVRPLIAIHGTVQVVNNAARSWFMRHNIRWRMCLPFAAGAAIGAALTTLFIVQFIGEFFPLLLLLCLILYTLFKPRRLPQIKITDPQFFWVGIATGAMGIIAGAIDPLLAVFFLRDDLSKEEIVCNKSLMQMFAHLTKIPAFLFLGFSFLDNAGLILTLSLFAVIGAKLGVIALRYVNTQLFFTLMKVALYIAAGRIGFELLQLSGVQL